MRAAKSTPKSPEAQQLLTALDAELAAAAKRDGRDLVWSAAERQVLSMIGEAIDRKVELSAQYESAEGGSVAQVRLATELRLTEQAIAPLFKQISTEIAPPLSTTSLKAQRAANTRWNRERLKNSAHCSRSYRNRQRAHRDSPSMRLQACAERDLRA
jgi:hypothetical protein